MNFMSGEMKPWSSFFSKSNKLQVIAILDRAAFSCCRRGVDGLQCQVHVKACPHVVT